MKKILLGISVLALFLMSNRPLFDRPTFNLVHLTIINKAEMKIGVELTGTDNGYAYYFPVAKGVKENPTEITYDVYRDNYAIKIYYIQRYDPVYGYQCDLTSQTAIDIQSASRLVVKGCEVSIPNRGEPTQNKVGGSRR
ncbi:MAG: hypothetical protein WCI88_06810 [Chloroflexota bacterium]